MKAKSRLEQLKKQFDRLRKESLSSVGTANETIYSGLQKFADKEIKALTDYYDDALSALRSQKKSGRGLKTVVETQFDLLQKTITRLIDHGRESLEQARAEAKSEVSKVSAKVKSTVPPRRAASTVPPKRANSTVPPKKPKKAASTVPPKKLKKVASTVPPKKAVSTVPPKRAKSTVPPKKSKSTAPRKKKTAATTATGVTSEGSS